MSTYTDPSTPARSPRRAKPLSLPSMYAIMAVCLVATVASLSYAGYVKYDSNRQQKALRAQVDDLTRKVDLLPSALATGTSTQVSGAPKAWVSFSSGKVSFEYPDTAVVLNTTRGDFQYSKVTYSISSVSADGAVGVTDWMQAHGIAIADCDPSSAAGHPAYTLKASPTTYFKVGTSIYVVTATGAGAVASASDEVYVHLLGTLKVSA